MCWRLAVVVLLVFLGAELTGVARAVGRWAISRCVPSDHCIASTLDDCEIEGASIASGSDCDDKDAAPWLDRSEDDIGDLAMHSSGLGPMGDAAAGSGAGNPFGEALANYAHRSTWWPGIIWVGGVLLLGIRLMLGRLLVLAYRWRNLLQSDTELCRRLNNLAQRLGMNPVRSVVVSGITGPVAFGIIRPTVGVPPCFTSEFDATQQTVMLAHELEHLAARDPAWYVLTDLMVAAFWWHPLAWWARRQLRTASEWAADEASLIVQNGPDVLATCLVQLGRRLLRAQRSAWLGIEGGGFRSGLGRRVARLLSLGDRPWRHPRGLQSVWMRILLTVTMVVAALVSTGWSNMNAIPKGETMRLSLKQSWRQSLAAVALFCVIGDGNAPAAGTPMPDELLLGFVYDPAIQKEGDEPSRQEASKHAQAIRQKLQQVDERIEELKQNGKLDEAEKLSAEKQELKAALEKLNTARSRIVKQSKRTDADTKGKESLDSIDALRERMKQLEEENAKLRKALADTKSRNIPGGAEKGREDIERAHKELLELHEKLSKDHHDRAKKEEFDTARSLLERANDELAGAARQKALVPLQEKLQQLGEEKAKLKGKGRLDDVEKVEGEMRKLAEVAEKVAKVRGEDYPKLSGIHVQDLGAVLKELREEVSQLRNEVAELRHIVKEGESKDQKRSIR
jgi:hypothetical protein